MEYKIIASGSKGNCVVINRLMVDCGISYKKLEKYLYKIDMLFLTHKHTDHVNKSTLNQIIKYHPKIKIVCSKELKDYLKIDSLITVKNYTQYNIKLQDCDLMFQPFECIHNVTTQGIVFKYNDVHCIYATDTNNLDNSYKCTFGDGLYDYFFIEANYDEYKLSAVNKNHYKYDVVKNARRHFSKQDSYDFYLLNRRSIDSEYIELHKSERFY